MADSDQPHTAAPERSQRSGRAFFKGAFGIALGVILVLVLAVGVLSVLFM